MPGICELPQGSAPGKYTRLRVGGGWADCDIHLRAAAGPPGPWTAGDAGVQVGLGAAGSSPSVIIDTTVGGGTALGQTRTELSSDTVTSCTPPPFPALTPTLSDI